MDFNEKLRRDSFQQHLDDLLEEGDAEQLHKAATMLNEAQGSSATAESCVGAYSFEHECEKILDWSDRWGDQRNIWVGEIQEIGDDLPDEEYCLHIETPEKDEIVFGLVFSDFICLAGIIYGVLGYVPDNPIVERVAEQGEVA